jgi:hypothetical protein
MGLAMGIRQGAVPGRRFIDLMFAVLIGLAIGNLITPVHVLAVPDPNALKCQGPDTIGNPQQFTFIGQSSTNSLQTPLTNSATSANTTLNFGLAAAAGKTTYISGFTITGNGATAASVVTAVLSNTVVGNMSFKIPVPAGVGLSINPLVVQFVPAIPANAQNTQIILNVPAFGAGNTDMAATLNGWRE